MSGAMQRVHFLLMIFVSDLDEGTLIHPRDVNDVERKRRAPIVHVD